jgi:hypothetical protein
VNQLKHFLEVQSCEKDIDMQDMSFNHVPNDRPITWALAKLIKYKEAAHLALLILNEEGETQVEIDSFCDRPCPLCNAEND